MLPDASDDESAGDVRVEMHPLMMRYLQLNLDASEDETPVSLNASDNEGNCK